MSNSITLFVILSYRIFQPLVPLPSHVLLQALLVAQLHQAQSVLKRGGNILAKTAARPKVQNATEAIEKYVA